MQQNNRYKLLKSDINLASILVVLSYGIITYLVTLLILPVIVVSFFGVNISSSVINIISLIAQFFVCMPIAIIILRVITGVPFKVMLSKPPKLASAFGKSTMLFCMPIFVSGVLSILVTSALSLIKVDSSMPTLIENKSSIAEIIISAVCAVVIGPITEEIIFRGFLLKLLSRHNAWFSVIVTAFMFAIYHCNIEQGVNAFILGIFLGVTAVKTGSVIIPILLHILNNVIGYTFLFLPSSEMVIVIANIIYMATALVVGLLGVILYRKQFSLKGLPKEFSGKACAKAFFTSPAMWVMVVIFVLLIVLSFNSVI